MKRTSTLVVGIVIVTAMFAAHATAQDCLEPPAGLVSWWPGDGNADDISGTNDGTLQGGATFAPGRVDQAFSFNGVDAIVIVPDSPSLNPDAATGFTVDAWARSNTTSGNGAVVVKGDPFEEQYVVDQNNGAWRGVIRDASNNPVIVIGPPVQPGVFTHLALTWNGTILRFYVNGIPVDDASAISIRSSDVFLGIGGQSEVNAGGRNFHFNGLVDEVEFFNRALSAPEVQAIFDAGSAGKCGKPPPPPTIEELLERIEDLEDHTHTYRTGSGEGHNNTEAETGEAGVPGE